MSNNSTFTNENIDLTYKTNIFYYLHIFLFFAVIIITLYEGIVYTDFISILTGFIAAIIFLANAYLARKGHLEKALFFSIILYYPQLAVLPLYLGPIYYGAILCMTSIYFMISSLINDRRLVLLNNIGFTIALLVLFYGNTLNYEHFYKTDAEKNIVEIFYAIIGGISILAVHFIQNKALFKYEATLSESETKLNKQNAVINGIFNNTLDGILAFDQDQKLVAFNNIANKKFAEYLGKKLQINANATDFLPVDYQEDHNLLVQETQKGKPTIVESKVTYKNKPFYFKFIHVPAMDKEGSILGSVLIIKNVTRRKEQELQLKELLQKAQESDRLKSAFIANISHEIRTPMNGILGFSELMLSPDVNPVEQEEYANIINNNCQQLMQIVDDLLDIAKIETGSANINKTDILLKPFLEELHLLFIPVARQKGIELSLCTFGFPPDLYIRSDKKKVRQIISNLLSNALKFTKNGSVKMSSKLECKYLIFTVKDTGVGIPEDKKNVVFERFQQAKIGYERDYDGTGLGLSISKGFAILLGGDIQFESEEDVGTSFFFTLPYEEAVRIVPEAPTTKRNDANLSFRGKTILLAEDIDFNAKLIQKTVEPMQGQIIRVKTGKEAIAAVEQYPEIDLILMDIKMPEMSGTEAAHHIKLKRTTPIVALTASNPSDDDELQSSDFDDYLAKPFNRTQLVDCLKKYLY